MSDSLVAYLLCKVSVINVCLEYVLEAQWYFLFPALLLIIQFFSNKFCLHIQLLSKYLKYLYALERSQHFLSLEKEPFFLNGGLLFSESIYFVSLLGGVFNYFKSIET